MSCTLTDRGTLVIATCPTCGWAQVISKDWLGLTELEDNTMEVDCNNCLEPYPSLAFRKMKIAEFKPV